MLSCPIGIAQMLFSASAADSPNEYHVSPSGSDRNSGTSTAPFASIHRARDVIRENHKSTPPTVYLRSGTYYLNEPIVFTHEDSGTPEAPILYAAYPGEDVTVSGGQRLCLEWQSFRDDILMARVPEGLEFDQLFINGVRQHMARYPNYDTDAQYFNGFAADAFSRERADRWQNPRGGFIHAMHRAHWGDFHYAITGKDEQGNLTYEGGWQNNRQMGMHDEHRFVENIFEELDAPGEWYLDTESHTLYCIPPDGVDLAEAKVECVRLRHLIEFQGTEDTPVAHIQLRGLKLTHTARTFMDTREPLLRSDWAIYRGGTVFVDGAEDIVLENLHLASVGGNGIFINNYNRRITIRGCHIENAGANAICFVGSPDAVRSPLFEYQQTQHLEEMDHQPGPCTADYPGQCVVHDNLLVRSGRFEKQTTGVQISMAMNITVSHNTIHDVPRSGINISEGTWGGHLLEYNDVFDTVKETGDHGSFNSWGRDRFWHPNAEVSEEWVAEHPDMPRWDAIRTTVIRNNRFRCDHGWDIDLDDGSTNYEIYHNLCLNGGLKNREGYHRKVYSNIMVNNSFHPHVWYANSKDVFRSNIVFTRYRPIRVLEWGDEIDHNFHHMTGSKTTQATVLQESSGKDERSLQGDAMFVDPASGDYRVRDGSPALQVGFTNFPMDQFGVVSPGLRALAKTPVLPEPAHSEDPHSAQAENKSWQGATIENLLGLGKMSATGMDRETGVYFTQVPDECEAAVLGFEEGDVLLQLAGRDIRRVADLLAAADSLLTGKGCRATVFRYQRSVTIDIHEGCGDS